jgi:spore germination cell wall hydrolase CwlJ-like protein
MKYATLYPILWIALLVLCVLMTYLTVCTVKYYQVRSEVGRLKAEVVDVTNDWAGQAKIASKYKRNWETLSDLNFTLVATNAVLRKDISEMEDEITSSRAERRPFDPTKATPTRLMAQIVAAECGPTATYDECRMVAQVIVNRANRSKASLLDTITAPGQFTPVASGAWVWATPTPVEMAAAYNAVNHIDSAYETFGASDVLYFCAAGHEDQFFKTKLVLDRRIGDTAFYRTKEG